MDVYKDVVGVPKVFLGILKDGNKAIMISQMIYWNKKTKRTDGYFYKTYKEWSDELFMSERKIRNLVSSLKELGYLDTKVERANNVPTVHYKVNIEKLNKDIEQYLKDENIETQENKEEKPKQPKRNKYDDQIDEVIDYLNEKAEKQFRKTTNANRKFVRDLLIDGYTVDDLKKIIRIKVAEWKENPKMNKYLRPQTLFNKTKADKYVNEKDNTVDDDLFAQGMAALEDDNVIDFSDLIKQAGL